MKKLRPSSVTGEGHWLCNPLPTYQLWLGPRTFQAPGQCGQLGLVSSPQPCWGRRGTVVGWVAFLCSYCTYPDLDPSRCFFLLLLPPEGLKVPSPSSRPHPLTLTLLGGSLTRVLGGQGSMALRPSPPFGTPLREDGDKSADPSAVLGGKRAHWGSAGKAWPDPQGPSPFSCLEHSRACQPLPQAGPLTLRSLGFVWRNPSTHTPPSWK